MRATPEEAGGVGPSGPVGRGEGEACASKACAGYALLDPLGREVGRVEELFVNGGGFSEYVSARVGGLWRKRGVLIPVESVSVDDGERTVTLR